MTRVNCQKPTIELAGQPREKHYCGSIMIYYKTVEELDFLLMDVCHQITFVVRFILGYYQDMRYRIFHLSFHEYNYTHERAIHTYTCTYSHII